MTIHALIFKHPIAAGLALVFIAGLFRLVDIFVLRLDERWGEIIVSKVITVVLVFAFLFIAGFAPSAAGLHSRAAVPSVLLGVGLTAAALLLGYAVEFIVLTQSRSQSRSQPRTQPRATPRVRLAAIDPKSGSAGAASFAILLLIGNLINSFAEEGLFRGVLIPLFHIEIDMWPALGFSAFFFGIWHLPWAIKTIKGTSNLKSVGVMGAVITNFLPQALLGFVWGYLYVRTGNLWGPWVAHTLTNSAVNFVHVRSAKGLDSAMPVRMSTYTILMILGTIVIWYVSNRYQLPQIQPWNFGNTIVGLTNK